MPTVRLPPRCACLLLLVLPLTARPDPVNAAPQSPATRGSAPLQTGVQPTLRFLRVWPSWRDEDSFRGVREYFNRRETTGGWTLLRSRPATREGYYFLVHTDNAAAGPRTGRFIVRVVDPQSPDPREFRFETQIPAGQHVFQIGLTGKDWAGKTVHPVAWDVEFIPDDGGAGASRMSFLWARPAS